MSLLSSLCRARQRRSYESCDMIDAVICFCFVIEQKKNWKWGCLSGLTCITGGSDTCFNAVFNVTDITWGSTHRLCMCVCVSTHLTVKMAPCFSHLHGCRILEALQVWQQVAGAVMSAKLSIQAHTILVNNFQRLLIHSAVIGNAWRGFSLDLFVVLSSFLFSLSVFPAPSHSPLF